MVTIVIIGLGVIWKLTKKEPPVSVTNFEECAQAGNPVMESYPRQCRHDGKLFVETITTQVPPLNDTQTKTKTCTAESRQGDVCAQVYAPVCARVNIQCIKAPCNPIEQTFSNNCEACHNGLVESYSEGECK